MMALTMRNQYNKFTRGNMYRDDVYIDSAHCYDGTDYHVYNQASISVAITCEAGQKLWVQAECQKDAEVQGEHTICTGHLI